ncbi:hypothetical protein TNCV_5050411 [Trichonephila clavipes]|nr:hypothetical protein TNCV_5050411 [Trichonephila clavipes]
MTEGRMIRQEFPTGLVARRLDMLYRPKNWAECRAQCSVSNSAAGTIYQTSSGVDNPQVVITVRDEDGMRSFGMLPVFS